VISAYVQGATSIGETMAQYTALMVMKHHFGPESMKRFLRFELDQYLRGRGQERNEEEPLYNVDPNQGHIHHNKSAMAMYALQDYIGEDKVNEAIRGFLKEYAFKGPPYPTSLDLEGYFRKVAPPEYQYLFDDMFCPRHRRKGSKSAWSKSWGCTNGRWGQLAKPGGFAPPEDSLVKSPFSTLTQRRPL
jgi:ABC-2 type transport system permease protein